MLLRWLPLCSAVEGDPGAVQDESPLPADWRARLDAIPEIDAERCLELTGGDGAQAESLLRRVAALALKGDEVAVVGAAARQDRTRLGHEVHKIKVKGSVGQVGAVDCVCHVLTAEAALRPGVPDATLLERAEALVTSLETLAASVRRVLGA